MESGQSPITERGKRARDGEDEHKENLLDEGSSESQVLFEILPSSSGSDDDEEDDAPLLPSANLQLCSFNPTAGGDELKLGTTSRETTEPISASPSQHDGGSTHIAFPQGCSQSTQRAGAMLKKYNSVDVHRVFQQHWKRGEEREALFYSVPHDTLSPQARQRYCQIVNVENWNTNKSLIQNGVGIQEGDAEQQDDILIPIELLDPNTLPSPAVGQGILIAAAAAAAAEDEDDLPGLSLGIPMLKTNAKAHVEQHIPLSGDFSLRPHQIDGIRFMWKRLAHLPPKEDVPATGCILAHSMGLGKTCQTLVFLHLFYKHVSPKAKTLLVLPKSVISSWSSEYKKWSRYFSQDPLPCFEVLNVSAKVGQRLQRLQQWMQAGGVLVMGYESLSSLYKTVAKMRDDRTISLELDQCLFTARQPIDLVICDEGHRLKNDGLQVGVALKALHPRRRLVITGTPLQNHLMEYWAMVEFILPKYFTKKSFRNYFIQPIKDSMHKDAPNDVVQLAKKRTFTLIQELNFYVHRRDNAVLRRELPPLHEFVCIVPLTPVQEKLYEEFLKVFRGQAKKSLLQAFSYAAKICAHPELLYTQPQHRQIVSDGGCQSEGSDDEISIITQQQQSAGRGGAVDDGSGSGNDAFKHLHVRPEGYEPMSDHSAKLSVALQLILMAKELGESCLVFSISTKLLDLFEVCLQQAGLQHQQDADFLKYIRLDGSTSGTKREELIDRFQSETEKIDVFLLSMKAGGLGVTLTAATRVIILDCAWNPAEDQQAVGRAYRYGQKKPVFIYRLVCNNTIEHRVFDQKVGKEWLFRTVVDTDTMKRDTLKGPKLQEVFCMTDPFCAQPLREDWTEQCCRADPLINAVKQQGRAGGPSMSAPPKLLLAVMPHDSLLEEDPVKYGDEEQRAYKDFVQRGGLWLAEQAESNSAVGAGQRARYAEESKEVKLQSRSLLATLGKIIEAKHAAASTTSGGGKTSSLLARINKVNRQRGGFPAGGGATMIDVDDRFLAPVDRSELQPRGKVLIARRRVDGLGSTKDIPLAIEEEDADGTPLPAAAGEYDREKVALIRAKLQARLKGGGAKHSPRQPENENALGGDDEDDPLVID